MSEDLVSAFCRPVAPPSAQEPLAVWAPRVLRVPDEENPGNPPRALDYHPAHSAIWRAYDDGYTQLNICGPVQDGKTLAALISIILYQMTVDRRSAVVAAPRIEDIADLHRGKLLPIMAASGLDIMPQEGKGSTGGVPESILTIGGTRLYYRGCGGSNEAQLAGFTVRTACITEADSIAISTRNARRRTAGGDGRRKINLLAQRTARYQHDARLVIESTIKLDHGSLILDLWESGTAGLLWHPCPWCSAWAPRTWEHVTYDAENDQLARQTARYNCPHCGGKLATEDLQLAAQKAVDVHRGQEMRAGQRCGIIAPNSAWSILWGSIDSPLRRLDWLTVEHAKAIRARDEHDNHEPLRQFTRDHLSKGYKGAGSKALGRADWRALAARSAASTYDRGHNPLSPDSIVTIAGDHQLREIFHVTAALDDERIALLDWGVEYLCHKTETPATGRRAEICERIQARALDGVLRHGGQPHAVQLAGMDVGGRGWLSELDAWIMGTPGWVAVRGDTREKSSQPDRILEGNATAAEAGWWTLYTRTDGRLLLAVDTAAIKTRIVRGLSLPPDHPCACLLPVGIAESDWLLRHLTAEEQRQAADGTLAWHQVYPRNDWFDGLVYTVGLARFVASLQKNQPASAEEYLAAALAGSSHQ